MKNAGEWQALEVKHRGFLIKFNFLFLLRLTNIFLFKFIYKFLKGQRRVFLAIL
jgi:hypothetical protein